MGDKRATPGKRVGGALYLHRSALGGLEAGQARRVQAVTSVCDAPWNVAKVALSVQGGVSLLDYDAFDAVAFPALRQSYRLGATGELCTRRYGADNPPILHRKELLLPLDHPDRARFARLTAELEARGLFVDMPRRGRRKPWAQALQDAGVAIEDHRVVDLTVGTATSNAVERHRTAIARDALSAPVSALHAAGLLTSEVRLLDYGCGRGDDIRLLSDAGIDAIGWDPHYAPDRAALMPRPVVNLGFVLNVIEDVDERRQALRHAWALTEQVLSVAVMLVGKGDVSGHLPCKDGFLTSRKTFQKYYAQAEIKTFIAETLGQTPVAAGPGVFFVFADEMMEQRHLTRRMSPGQDLASLKKASVPAVTLPNRDPHRQKVLTELAQLTLSLGRVPQVDELPARIKTGLRRAGLSFARALTDALHELSERALHAASTRRKNEIERYFAMQHFAARTAYRSLDVSLQRDVKAFFGTMKAAEQSGRALLFSVGDAALLLAEAQASQDSGVGCLRDGDFIVHVQDIARLTPKLRTYVAIAELIIGTLEPATVLGLHIDARKLSIYHYPEFDTEALPRLSSQTVVDFRTGDVRYRDHKAEARVTVLTGKSAVMRRTDSNYAAQAAFDVQLFNLLPPSEAFRAPFSDIAQILLREGVRLPY